MEEQKSHTSNLQTPGIHWVPGVIWKHKKQRTTSWKVNAVSESSLRRHQSLACVASFKQRVVTRRQACLCQGEMTLREACHSLSGSWKRQNASLFHPWWFCLFSCGAREEHRASLPLSHAPIPSGVLNQTPNPQCSVL